MFKFEQGVKLKDRVTNFEGIVTARCQFLNGCVRYILQPPMDKDKKIPEEKWFDEGQLVLVDKGVTNKIKQKLTGGPTGYAVPKY